MLDPALYNFTICTTVGPRALNQSSKNQEWSVACAPNPAAGQIRIHASDSKEVTLRCAIFDLFGKCIIEPFFFQSDAVINLDSWDTGVYFVQLTDPSGTLKTGRFVKI